MNTSTFLRRVRNFLPLLALAAVPAIAQTGLGTVSGTVRDSSNATVPKASITLTNTATGVNSTTDTNSAGLYSFSNVQIGSYVLTVAVTGFEKWSGTFEVPAGQTVTIDPTLNVGNVQTKVEVTGAATPLTTEGGQVSDVKDAIRIHDLPLNGRLISNLFDLTPGVVGGGNPRTNGMKVGSTEMVLDGVSQSIGLAEEWLGCSPGSTLFRNSALKRPVPCAVFASRHHRVGNQKWNEPDSRSAFETFRNNAAGLRARRARTATHRPSLSVTSTVSGPAARLSRTRHSGLWTGKR